jgi:hypothetical protein
MASAPAIALWKAIQGRCMVTLTTTELMRCEEIVVNVFPKPVMAFVKRRDAFKTFGHAYVPLMNGMIKGAIRRRERFCFDTLNKQSIYYDLDKYLGDGYSLNELEDIVWMSENFNIIEIKEAMLIAERNRIISTSYVRAVAIKAQRTRRILDKRYSDTYKKIMEKPSPIQRPNNVERAKADWNKKLLKSFGHSLEHKLEQQAIKKSQIQKYP